MAASRTHRISDLLGDTMAIIAEHADVNAISIDILLPVPAAFEIVDPSPDLQAVVRGLLAFLAWPASWQIDSDPMEV